ncbi:MAG: hypothetical protein ACFFEA_11380 [Candidatus Thorarchaeota archaeon]
MDWLRKGRPLDDSTIIRHIMLDAVQKEIKAKLKQLEQKKTERSYGKSLANWLENQSLNASLFEREFNLPPVNQERVPFKMIDDALRYSTVHQDVSRRETPIRPDGDSLEKQVLSLLPACKDKTLSNSKEKQEYMVQKRRALVYFLSRVTLSSLPNPKFWPVLPIGLDCLTAALITLHFISQAENRQIHWLSLIWKYEIERYRKELLQDLLASLSPDIRINETDKKLNRVIEEIKEDLPNDPFFSLVHEWQEKLREYNPREKLVDCIIFEQQDGRESKHGDRKQGGGRKAGEDDLASTTNLRRLLSLEIAGQLESSVKTPQTPQPRSHWTQTRITADSPLSYVFEGFLSSARAELNVLRFDQLLKTCEYLADIEIPGKPTNREIANAAKIGVRSAQSFSLGLILTERYIPSLMDLGLKHRYIFTRMKKSAVDSIGLAERISVAESEDYQIVTKHLEPKTSEGPDENELPDNCFHTTVETDIISMRMDLYDTEKREWRDEPWTFSMDNQRKNQWLIRKTASHIESYSMPTQRELDLLSIITSISANSHGIKQILKSLEFPQSTAKHHLSQFLTTNRVRLLYHPSLEYVGLPEGILLAAQFKTLTRLDEFIEWLVSSFPYVHVQYSMGEKSLVSRVRVPRFSKSEGLIRQELRTENALRAIGTISRNRTYHMSSFHRLYQSKNEPWKDPWLHS